MSARRPRPSPHSEEELLEQWDFLDNMVERQAAALRAGIQDVEEDDAGAAPELDGLRRRLEEISTQLASSQKLHAEARTELDQLRQSSAALGLERQNLTAAHAQALDELTALRHRLTGQDAVNNSMKETVSAQEREIAALQEQLRATRLAGDGAEARRAGAVVRAERLQLELDAVRRGATADLAGLQQRLQQAEVSASRWQSTHRDMLEALRSAHQELELLRVERAAEASRRHFWKRRR